MPKVGSKLRETRETKNLTLKDVEQATNIRKKYLDALESGEYRILPGEVYVKGFIRNYSEYLGLDPEEILLAYKCEETEEQLPETIENSKPKQAVNTKNVGSFKEKIHKEKRKNHILYVIVIVMLLVGIYWGLDVFTTKETTNNNVSQNNTAVLEKKNEPIQTGKPSKENNLTKKNESLSLEVQASRRCWVFVLADGKKIYEGILEKDEKTVWQAKEKLTVKLGDATALRLFLNKKSITIKAKDGEVIEREFTLKDI